MTFIDLSIIACVGINMLIGYKRGFIWTVVGLSSYMIAALLSKWFYKDLSLWIQNYTGIFSKLENFVDNNFYQFFQDNTTGLTNLSEIEGRGILTEFVIKNAYIQDYGRETVEMVKTEMVRSVATMALNIISVVIIFLVAKGSILLLGRIIDEIFKLPVLNSFNKTGGIIIGGVKGFIVATIIFMIMFVFSIISPVGKIASGIENSIILQFFFDDLFPTILNWLL